MRLRQQGIAPLGVGLTFVYWAIPAGLLYITHYVLVPWFVDRTGQPYLFGYLIAYVSTMGLFLAAVLVAYRLEGNPFKNEAFTARFRLQRMGRQDWLWSMGLLLLIFATALGLGITARWLARWALFAPHPIFPAEFGPEGPNARVAGTFMGSEVTGLWWVPAVFFLGWLFNIAGEELWFRGYLLPRQEMALGKRAWIANGLMFTFTHIWQPWNLLALLPASLIGAYLVQRRRNTWISIVSHALANASILVILVLNAFGVAV